MTCYRTDENGPCTCGGRPDGGCFEQDASGLRAAAVELDRFAWELGDDGCTCGDCTFCVWRAAARFLRQRADEIGGGPDA